MGKNKIAKWAELETFPNVLQPGYKTGDLSENSEHKIKGNWRDLIFGNPNPITLELACGKGEYTASMAEMYPGHNFIGIDIKGARMWKGAKTVNEKKLKNAAFLRTRIEFLSLYFAEDEVDEIWITFPDPHPSRKNSNKRLTCPWFLNMYRKILKNNGLIHLKTDNEELFNYTKNIVLKNGLEIIRENEDLYSDITAVKMDDPLYAIRTYYEEIFIKQGLQIRYISFRLDKKKIIAEDAIQSKIS